MPSLPSQISHRERAFEQFTDRTRQVVILAREEARSLSRRCDASPCDRIAARMVRQRSRWRNHWAPRRGRWPGGLLPTTKPPNEPTHGDEASTHDVVTAMLRQCGFSRGHKHYGPRRPDADAPCRRGLSCLVVLTPW